jgi:hypothetical protein
MTSTGILLVWSLGIFGGAIGATFGLLDGRARTWTYAKVAVVLMLLVAAPLLFSGVDGTVPFREFIIAGGGGLVGMYLFCWILSVVLFKKKRGAQ